MIRNENVFEIDLMPDGAAALVVTNAEWSVTPTGAAVFGMWIAARAGPLDPITPRYPEKMAGQ